MDTMPMSPGVTWLVSNIKPKDLPHECTIAIYPNMKIESCNNADLNHQTKGKIKRDFKHHTWG